jgi:hypothetical protein
MTESELTALLDAHDALVKSCVDSVLPIAAFLALYNDFPHTYALDGHEATPDERAAAKSKTNRVSFPNSQCTVGVVLGGRIGEWYVCRSLSEVSMTTGAARRAT